MGIAAEHLSRIERESIARGCFEVRFRKGDELQGLCPFHQEKNPSFSYNLEKDVFICFTGSCGAKGDLVNLWCHSKGLDRDSGSFKAFCEAYGIKGKRKPRKKSLSKNDQTQKPKFIPETTWQKLPPLPPDWVACCKEKFGWSADIISRFDLRLCVRGEEERIAIPIRDKAGELKNIRLYLPNAKADDDKVKSWKVGYGQARLFHLPDFSGSSPIFLCEGEKDTLCALSRGLNAITATTGAGNWRNELTKHFEDRDVVICYDADKPGQEGAEKIARILVTVAKLVRLLKWPDYMKMGDKHGQDLTDFFVTHGKNLADFKDLLASAKTVEKPKEPEIEDGPKRFFGGKNGTRFRPVRLAQAIMDDVELISDPEKGLIYRWNGQYWESYNLSFIRHKALTMLEDEASSARARDVADITRDLSILKHGRKMNDQTDWICLKNGMFNLKTSELVPFDENYYATYMLGVEYDPKASFERWEQFLLEAIQDADVIREIQKFFGYCLTRETRYEKSLLLIGPGGDGKSTLLNMLQEMVGEENCSNISMGSLEDQFYRSRLVDKLINVSNEIEGQVFSSDIFKAIISGDRIGASFKHQQPFDFRPFCKLAFSSNRYPRVSDNSDGFYRKLIVVEMKQQFVKLGLADIYLKEKLSSELSGIFTWAFLGLQLLKDSGFQESDAINQSLLEYKRFNNPVLCFVEECIESEPESKETKQDVYGCYRNFCKQWGYFPWSGVRFGRELHNLLPGLSSGRLSTGNRANCYVGVRLRPSLEPHPP